MKSNVVEVLKGFFWGVGFSIAAALCGTAYLLSALPEVDQAYKNIAEIRTKDSIAKIEKSYEVQILDIYKSDRLLKVTASVNNLTDQEVFGKAIKVDLFGEDGRFISSCTSERGDLIIRPRGAIYHEVTCKAFRHQIDKVNSARGQLKLM